MLRWLPTATSLSITTAHHNDRICAERHLRVTMTTDSQPVPKTQPADDSATNPTLMPFHGLQFAQHLPGTRGLADVIGPPADIESSDEARGYVRVRDLNAVHLEIEDDDDQHFSSARALLDHWRADGTLVEDHSSSYYVYDQSFDDFGERRTRRGMFGLVPIDAPDVCVLPHEETWEDNRQRRVQLLRDLNASISPILLVYDSPESQSALAEVTQRTPDAEDVDESGNSHRLWRVADPAEVERIQQAMQGRHYYIADGHHRYEAARMFHQETRQPDTGLILACCVEASDPGIVIRPIHRLVYACGSAQWHAALPTLERWFDVYSEPVGNRSGLDLLRSLPDDELPAAGVIIDNGATFVTLRLRDWEHVVDALDSENPAARLDVSVITDLLIHRALGIDPEQDETALGYANDANELLTAVLDGYAGLGILLRPVRLAQVFAVAHAHGRVPAKSTSFIPKVPIGLVMHAFAGDE